MSANRRPPTPPTFVLGPGLPIPFFIHRFCLGLFKTAKTEVQFTPPSVANANAGSRTLPSAVPGPATTASAWIAVDFLYQDCHMSSAEESLGPLQTVPVSPHVSHHIVFHHVGTSTEPRRP